MKFSNAFFAEFGKVICSLMRTGGELLPAEKELIHEIAGEIFPVSGQDAKDGLLAPWNSLFDHGSGPECHSDPREAFKDFTRTFSENSWSISQAETAGLIDLLFQVARAYGWSSVKQQKVLDELKAGLHTLSEK